MANYITLPIETDPEDLLDDAVAFIQGVFPEWEPSDGNLDFWILQAVASAAAELRDVASAVPDSIFRYFGDSLMGIPPVDAAQATCTTTWTMINNQGYTIPAGTQVGIRTAGDDLIPFFVQTAVTVPPGSTATAAGAVTLVAVNADADSNGIGTVGGPAELIDPLVFVNTITLATVPSGGADAEADDDYLTRLTQELALSAPRPILPGDFAIFAREIAGVGRATAVDGYNPFHNLLTANQASIETDASGWANEANTTLARSVAQAMSGVASLSMTAIAAGDMLAKVTPAQAVVPGEFWTGIANFRSAATSRQVRVRLRWYSDVGGTTLLSDSSGTLVNDVTTGWTLVTATGVAPAGAKSMRLMLNVLAPVLGEVHYADEMSIRRGSGSDWVPGGTPDVNNERMIAVAVTDTSGLAVSTAVKNAVDADLEARREVNFVVNVIDPIYIAIAVTVTVQCLPGFDTAEVTTNLQTEIAQYFSPINWGGDTLNWQNVTTVRYLEVAAMINNVQGVDYITTTGGNYDLTIGYQGDVMDRSDKPLASPVTLATLGTLTLVVLPA